MALPVYFAPMEGVTDSIYRRVHKAHFTGIDKYFIPFISPTQNLVLTPRERHNVSPEYNAGLRVIPQVLTKNADHFLWAAQLLYDMGYDEVNLNTGCPSGTVTAKGKGAGMLQHLPELECFLDAIFSRSPMRISIKTRIGFFSPEEYDLLLEIFNRYPMCELIVHPRTREEFYKGEPHEDVYLAAAKRTKPPLVYNGNLFTAEACRAIEEKSPETGALMLGRGLLANPALAQTYAGGAPLDKESLRAFHDDLLSAYMAEYPKNVVLGRMREVAKNICCGFEDAHKPLKIARKAGSIPVYEDAMTRLFEEYELQASPCFSPD
ncbi:MAG: tRNA-dihydrouridine synthase family protein [Clostridia bacterium]|nr:tRNA-dihydrouridine synthase family protein [Clostridia bacterium]MBQ4608257.1 tRNA-dihydrouridine synthase family protein [Clostridia bacterium]